MSDDLDLAFLFRPPNGNGFSDTLARAVDPTRRASVTSIALDVHDDRDTEMLRKAVLLCKVADIMLECLSFVEDYENRPSEMVRLSGDAIIACLKLLVKNLALLNAAVALIEKSRDALVAMNNSPDLTEESAAFIERERDELVRQLKYVRWFRMFTHKLREFYARWNALQLKVADENAEVMDKVHAAAAELFAAVGAVESVSHE